MKVIVLGAGVIGVTTAYFLARAGHEVVVIEKNSEPGLGCSYANGGQLSYSHIETWASKSSFLSLIKAAFTPKSFLSFPDLRNKEFLRWLYQFFKNSSKKNSHKNSRKLFTLSHLSKEALKDILKTEENIQFDYQNNGTLHFYRTKKNFEAAIKEAEFHESFGCKAKILTAQECVKKEPTLVKILDEGKLAGGIFYDMDASGNSFLFTKALAKICKDKYNVNFHYDTKITNILTNFKKITGIKTEDEVLVADKYVYACGAYGNSLLEGVRVDPMVYPLKGYSLSIDANDEYIAPKIALTDSENRVVYSRIGNIFRAAGTVEICGLGDNKNDEHLKFLLKSIKSTFSEAGNINKRTDWFGFRPFRPNSTPLICQTKEYDNLFLNVGHGSLGWTLSAGSGKAMEELVTKGGEGWS